MIEALAHDIGKATPQRWSGSHAKGGAEMLEVAGYGDEEVLMLIQRHHHQVKPQDYTRKTRDEEEGKKRDLLLLQLADRMAAQRRSEGGASNPFTTPEMGQQHLKLTETYLRFELRRFFNHILHRLTQIGEYTAFKRFVEQSWWLELVRASSTDASNESLRHHLLLTDAIYQQLLLKPQITQIYTDLNLPTPYTTIPLNLYFTIPKIEGRPKDISLRLRIMRLLNGDGVHPYGVWKQLNAEGIHKDRRFIARLLEEMEMVGILEKKNNNYNLKKGFAPKQRGNKPQITQITQKNNLKMRRVIAEMHQRGFEMDAIALEVGLMEADVVEVIANV